MDGLYICGECGHRIKMPEDEKLMKEFADDDGKEILACRHCGNGVHEKAKYDPVTAAMILKK